MAFGAAVHGPRAEFGYQVSGLGAAELGLDGQALRSAGFGRWASARVRIRRSRNRAASRPQPIYQSTSLSYSFRALRDRALDGGDWPSPSTVAVCCSCGACGGCIGADIGWGGMQGCMAVVALCTLAPRSQRDSGNGTQRLGAVCICSSCSGGPQLSIQRAGSWFEGRCGTVVAGRTSLPLGLVPNPR